MIIVKLEKYSDYHPGVSNFDKVFISVWRDRDGLHEIKIWENRLGFDELVNGNKIFSNMGRPHLAAPEYQGRNK